MTFRRIAFVLISLGCLLWFLTIGLPVVGTIQIRILESWIFLNRSLRYATSALGLLLVASGVALLTASFGRGYLYVFLTLGFLVGAPASFITFREFSIRSAEMLEIGEASALTFLYWAGVEGFFWGLPAGILGVIAYRLWKRKALRGVEA